MIAVPYLPAHARIIVKSKAQVEINKEDYHKVIEGLENIGESYTLMDEGVPVACMGVVPVTKYRAQVWAVMGEFSKGKMVEITRKVNEFLDEKNKRFDRIETAVSEDFVLGHKWVKLLKFKWPAIMPMYHEKQTYVLYGRSLNG